MKLESSISLNFGDLNNLYYNLLIEEDFDFKTKNIFLNIEKTINGILVKITTESILDLKIGSTALIKSLEIIEKTITNG